MTLKIIAVIISYFLGNISTSILIGRVVAGIDIREHGSGNAGTTNVLRTIGKKAAIGTLVGDVLKGVIAVLIGRYIGGEQLAMICGLASIIGHIWPAAFGFRGGKGVATGIGVMFTTVPLLAAISLVIGILVIAISRYVSLGSILGAVSLAVAAFFIDDRYFVWALIYAVLTCYTHRANIKRLIKKEESKINFSKSK